MTCPRSWEVRAAHEGRFGPADVAAAARHALTCEACRQELASLEALRALTHQLPVAAPSELVLRRLRRRVLRDAMATPSRRPRFVAAAMAAVIALGALSAIGVRLRGRALGTGTARVDAQPFAATFLASDVSAVTQTREEGVERVFVLDGDATLHVRKLNPRERFVVVVPDGEVEVRGTTFEVSVREHRTTRVQVDEGVVVVRIGGEVALVAGESWPTPAPSGDPSREVAAPQIEPGPPSPPPPPSSSGETGPTPRLSHRVPRDMRAPAQDASVAADRSPDDETSAYGRAVDAYRLGRFEDAADLLHRFGATYPASPVLEDALFLEAASQASAGHAEAAARLAERHGERFPTSFHAKEAALIVARRRRDQGDCEAVKSTLARWMSDAHRDPAVEAALGGCVFHPSR